MAIGAELLEVPFAEMVRELALAIADGQTALDRSAIDTLKFLISNSVDLVTEVTEIVEPVQRSLTLPDGRTVDVSNARVRPSGSQSVTMSLFQAGLQPTFYQFTEAQIEVKLSISLKRSDDGLANNVRGSLRAYAAPVNFRTANTYSYSAEGSSVLKATLRPVPPPPRLQPQVVTVNAVTNPPTVGISG